MAEEDLRDPAAERRAMRRAFLATAIVLLVALTATSAALLAARPSDHTYLYFLDYGNTNGVPYTAIVPLPKDEEICSNVRVLVNGSWEIVDTPYGRAAKVYAINRFTLTCRLETWKNLNLAFSTEGTSAAGRPAVRVHLESVEFALGSFLNVTFSETDPSWVDTRLVHADLFEGWNTIEIREELHKPAPR